MSKNFELLRRVQSTTGVPEPATLTAYPGAFDPRQVAEPTRTSTDWQRVALVLRRHWKWSATIAAVVTLSVLIITLLTKPVYESTARVQVDPPGTETFSLEGANGGTNTSEYLETQAKNLQSDQLALDVIHQLNLENNEEFVGREPGSDAERENRALRSFSDKMWVSRGTGSRLISVSFGAHDPVLAATVANTLVQRFIERDYEMRHQAILQSSQWLGRQLDDIRARMEASNKTLAEFQKTSGIAAVDDSQNTFSGQMTELSKQLMQAQADRIQLQSYLNRFSGSADSLPQISSNPVVQQLTQKLAEVRAELAQTLAVYGENHPNARKLKDQADELQSQLDAQRAEILRGVQTSYAAAQAREELMQNQMRGTTRELGMISQYNALKKEANANTELYNQLFAKIKEASIASESKSSNIRVVDDARVMDRPARPKRAMNVGLGLLAGLLGGIVFAFLKEGLQTTINTPDDVRRCVGTSTVSLMPVIGAEAGMGVLGRRTPQLPSPMFVLDRPLSPESEALRGLHTSLRFSQYGRGAQVLMIASPFPGEGKTTLACNLAVTLAQHGRRTCIVDLDLLKEGIAPAFGLHGQSGVTDILLHNAKVEDITLRIGKVPNLDILATGPRVVDPGALAASDAMHEMLRELRERYDSIVIDTSPIVPFASARAVAPLVDGIVLVSRAGSTTRDGLARAIELLQSVNSAPVIDVVLNGAEYRPMDYGYYRKHYQTAS